MPSAAVSSPDEQILRIRDEIDRIDAALMPLLALRIEKAQQIVGLRLSCGDQPSDPHREMTILSRAAAIDHHGLVEIYRHLFELARGKDS